MVFLAMSHWIRLGEMPQRGMRPEMGEKKTGDKDLLAVHPGSVAVLQGGLKTLTLLQFLGKEP